MSSFAMAAIENTFRTYCPVGTVIEVLEVRRTASTTRVRLLVAHSLNGAPAIWEATALAAMLLKAKARTGFKFDQKDGSLIIRGYEPQYAVKYLALELYGDENSLEYHLL